MARLDRCTPKGGPASRSGQTLHRQVAALCYRVEAGTARVLLITSRGTRRWIVPKGWPIDGMDDPDSALTEAWEEAGVKGLVRPVPLGEFIYEKQGADGSATTCLVTVYPVHVHKLVADYPEKTQRRRKWLRPKKAAQRVAERGLARIVRGFDPSLLGR